jgi:hypothetical protein
VEPKQWLSILRGGENMARRLVAAICMILVIGALSCAQKEEGPTAETVSGIDLWEIFGETYTEYGFWPGVEGIMEGKAPHGALVRTFVNAKGLKPGADGYPHGSLIIKENFMPDTTLAKLTVMYKVKGYDPESGDWFWAVYAPDGTVEKEGKIQSCIMCHNLRESDDYVFLRNLR